MPRMTPGTKCNKCEAPATTSKKGRTGKFTFLCDPCKNPPKKDKAPKTA